MRGGLGRGAGDVMIPGDLLTFKGNTSETLMIVEEVGPGWVQVHYMPGVNSFRVESGLVTRVDPDYITTTGEDDPR